MRSHVAAKDVVRNLLGYSARLPLARKAMELLHGLRHRRHPYMKRHPIDIAYGIETSGFIPPWLLRTGDAADVFAGAYVGCQPSCLRHALGTISNLDHFAFVDLGCGKGRALVVASEAPFRRLVGIELANPLAVIARRNARSVRQRYPRRTAIEIIRGDAASVPLPQGDLVIFLYHSFEKALVARVASRVAEGESDQREVFFIYENPVHGDVLDHHPSFTRWFSATVSCSSDERGFSPDDTDTIVIWKVDRTSCDSSN
jgi:SAM-dependent methyltransferase